MHKFCIFIIVFLCFNDKRRGNCYECIFCDVGIAEIPTTSLTICITDAGTCLFEHLRTLILVDISHATSKKSSIFFMATFLARAPV